MVLGFGILFFGMKQVVVYSSNIAKTLVTSCRERLK